MAKEFSDYDRLLDGRYEAPYTSDWLDIKDSPAIPVFVYGTLKSGESNAALLKDAKYLGKGETLRHYLMLEVGYGSFPVIIEDPDEPFKREIHAVAGEIYLVSPFHILALDKLERNGVMYNRELVKVFADDQPGVVGPYRTMNAFIYVGVKKHWQSRINNLTMSSLKTVGNKQVYDWIENDWSSHYGDY